MQMYRGRKKKRAHYGNFFIYLLIHRVQDILMTIIVLQNNVTLVLKNEQAHFASVRFNLST